MIATFHSLFSDFRWPRVSQNYFREFWVLSLEAIREFRLLEHAESAMGSASVRASLWLFFVPLCFQPAFGVFCWLYFCFGPRECRQLLRQMNTIGVSQPGRRGSGPGLNEEDVDVVDQDQMAQWRSLPGVCTPFLFGLAHACLLDVSCLLGQTLRPSASVCCCHRDSLTGGMLAVCLLDWFYTRGHVPSDLRQPSSTVSSSVAAI